MSVTFRTPLVRVYVDNQQVTQVLSCTVNLGYDLATAQAEVLCPVLPAWAQPWSTVTISLGATAHGLATRFSGFLVEFDYSLYPRAVKLVCRGMLILADRDQNSTVGGTDMTLGGAGQTDQAMVTSMLSNAGLGGASQQIGGTGKTLGAVATDQFYWNEGESALAFIQRLEQICLGYRTYEGPGGTLYRSLITPVPTASAALSFTEGVDIERGTHQDSILDVANRAVVSGYDPGDGGGPFGCVSSAPSPWVPNAGYITFQVNSSLIEKGLIADAGSGLACEDVADWQLAVRNRRTYKVQFTTPRDDLLVPGMTIGVSSGRLNAQTNYWLQHVDVSVDEQGQFSQVVTGVTGLGGGGPITVPQNPLVDFSMTLESESVLVAGVATVLYLVSCTALPMPTSAPITTYAWTAAGGGVPASGSKTTFTVAFTSLASASITLLITDSGGNTGTVTKAPPAATAAVYANRKLYTAEPTQAAEFTGTAWVTTALAGCDAVANAPCWASGGNFLGSVDDMATTFTSTAPSTVGTINAIWVETDVLSSRVLIGGSTGNLALSADGGQTWLAVAGPGGGAILRVVINRFLTSQWFVLTASGLYRTDNAGGGWLTTQAAQAGETFVEYSAGANRGMIGMRGGRMLIDRDSGTTQTFSGATGTTGIVAVTADIKEDRFYALNQAGQGYYHSAAGGNALASGALAPAVPVDRGLWRDGALRDLLYMACGTGGLYKSVDGLQSVGGFYLLRTAAVNAVGIDGLLSNGPTCAALTGNQYLRCEADTYSSEPASQIVASTTTILQALWNGTSNNAPPSGWQTVGFNDSAWVTFTDATTASGGGDTWWGPFGPYPRGVWNVANSGPAAAQVIFRQHFTMTKKPNSVLLGLDGPGADVYINGLLVFSNLATSGSFTVPASVFKCGANVIAVWSGKGAAGSPFRFASWQLSFS